MAYATDQQLMTIQQDGELPETRFANPQSAQDFVRRMIQNDERRGKKRGLVAGLVDGNAPYNHRKLREANRADAANVNFGTARSYIEAADSAFYDLISQAPGFVQLQQSYGEDPEQKLEYSRIMAEEADKIFSEDEYFSDEEEGPDGDMQISQNEMVLNGTGPLWFEDEMAVFPFAIESADLKVPDRTRSKLNRWETCCIIWDYYPPELFKFINDRDAAETAGWNVDYTRSVIQNAMDIRQKDTTITYSWEYYQNQLKQNACDYYDGTLVCKLAHLYWREFAEPGQKVGRVTHAIVERETNATNSETDPTGGIRYLYFKKGRYGSFKEAIHPMYIDKGRGGYHHHVTGLGVKQYGPMELENRTLCNLYDKVFAPKILFKPTSTEASTKFQIARFGDWGLLPPGTEAIQNPINGFITDGLAMFNTSSELMRSILAGQRQPVSRDKPGNPVTAFEKKLNTSEQSSLSNTTYSRYYKQLDALYFEIVRRLCNLNSTDGRAKKFQENCEARGCPQECFGCVTSVKAVRVIGEGSPFMRQSSLMEFMSVAGGLPEEGQDNWRKDLIAAKFGASAVARYNPSKAENKLPDEQTKEARLQIASARVGMPPTITSSQQPLRFAGEFLGACVQAVNSLQQGGNPQQVLQFLNTLAPAAHAHIQRAMKDPIKKPMAEKLEEQWERLAKTTQKLKAMVQKQAEQQKQQRQKTMTALSDSQIKIGKTIADERRKDIKLRAQLSRDQASHRLKLSQGVQNMQLQDAKMASEIHRSNMSSMEE